MAGESLRPRDRVRMDKLAKVAVFLSALDKQMTASVRLFGGTALLEILRLLLEIVKDLVQESTDSGLKL
jgi:hypothetical protein